MASGDESPVDTEDLERGHGHFFVKKTFHRPTYCHQCTDMLWGLIGQGYVCEVCNFIVHERCLRTVLSPCSSIAATLVKNPVPHCWSEPSSFKRKFCNLCRKRLEDSLALRCEICEYYIHADCQDFAVSDCKDCATYVPQEMNNCVVQCHHWREGNLSGNSKCVACKKTCWSAEVPAGMRCEWCGVTAHATCYKGLPQQCNFGCLREILLPPYCLTVPRIDVPQEALFNLSRKVVAPISEEFSSGSDSKTEDERPVKDKECKDKDRERDEVKRMKKKKLKKKMKATTKTVIVRIYDGNASVRKRLHRTVAVPKTAPAQVLLVMALRTFHMSEDPINYYLSEVTQTEPGERLLDLTQPIHGQFTSQHGKRPAVLLRYNEPDSDHGYMRIYYKGISNMTDVRATYRHVAVTSEMTTLNLIKLALKKFCFAENSVDERNYTLTEIALGKGISERELDENDRPWLILQNSRRESLRQSRMMRFCVKEKEDPHGPHISIFISNLPKALSEKQYEVILQEIVKENKWSRADVFYYEYGAVVLIYNDAQKATQALKLLKVATYDEKQLVVLLLPNIQPSAINDSITPLLVLVNVRSGGQQGSELIKSFRKLLNPYQVYDLMNGGPLPGLYVFRNIPFYKILVCGGDGSVGWALACLDNVGQDAQCQYPPMAIVPLGTGNDLARVLSWGPGFTGGEDPLNLLRSVIEAEEIKLDRWTVVFKPNEKEQDTTKMAVAMDTNTAPTSEDPTSINLMNNYFGIGLDADMSLDFHQAREENPNKFNSRMHNKGVYFRIGLKRIFQRPPEELAKFMRLEVDGNNVDIPGVQGIIILNILSWASGCNPWGDEPDEKFARPTHYDGLLEVVGITSVFHMSQIQSGFWKGNRIAQGAHVRIQILEELPVQVDGEPQVWQAGQVMVIRSALTARMLKKVKKMKRYNTVPGVVRPSNESAAGVGQGTSDGNSTALVSLS